MVVNQAFGTDTPRGTTAASPRAAPPLWQAFAGVVRRGRQAGDFAPGDPGELTVCYFATLSGLTTMRLALREEMTLPGADLRARGRPT